VEIIDINDKRRTVSSIKRKTVQILDAVNGGIATTKEYIEVAIVGKTRNWTEWYPLEQFVVKNPDAVID
jgi:hypothetical protein